VNIVEDSKENTDQLIILGGGAAVEKVKIKWPDNQDVPEQVQNVLHISAAYKAQSGKGRIRTRRLGLIGCTK
jgi:hypothetical protein